MKGFCLLCIPLYRDASHDRSFSHFQALLFYFAKMRVYYLPRGKRVEHSFVSLWSESGPWSGHGRVWRSKTTSQQPPPTITSITIDAATTSIFFLDATKKYGQIITSFVVVPFALRVVRVVKLTDVNPPAPFVPPTP